jgi:hypothetical protein
MKYFEYQGEEGWAPTGYLWKTDSTGTTEWLQQQYYDFENITTDFIYCVKEIADGYAASGFQLCYDEEGQLLDEDGFLMKTDAAGNMIWQQVYDLGEGTNDVICSLCPTNRGGYLLSGCTWSIDEDDGSLWMLKTDENGNEQWNEVYDGPNFEYSYARDCFETSDGGGIMCGNTNSYGAGQVDTWIIKTDTMGDIDWDKTIGDIRHDYTWDMCKTTDGGYVVVICKDHQHVGGTKDDILLAKTTEDGYTEWTYLIEENDIQIPVAVRQTNDGGYIVGGRTRAVGSQFSDAILYKLSAIENQRPDKPVILSGPTSGHKFTEYTFTTSTTDPDGDDVLFMWDWGDGNYSEWLDAVGASYEWYEIGEYEIRVMAKDINDGESEWSDIHTISITKNKAITINPIYQRLQKNHPNLFTLLQRLFQRLTVTYEDGLGGDQVTGTVSPIGDVVCIDEGCTPGYWKKNPKDQDGDGCPEWPGGYHCSDYVYEVFSLPVCFDDLNFDGDTDTLMDALKFHGGFGYLGKARNLLRHAVAALLNAAHPCINYAIGCPQEVIDLVHDTLMTYDICELKSVKNMLDEFNNAGCPCNAHGDCE